MKNSILLIVSAVFFFPFFSNSQKKYEKRIHEYEKRLYQAGLDYYNNVIGQSDKDFDITQSPQEWKSEPVVVLCQKIHINLFRNTFLKTNLTKGIVRKRVLIQDKAALEEFSEFYYQAAQAIGIRHIKPDGTSNDIDLETAVKVENGIPRFYTNSYHSGNYYKIAIPDLEVGDILDYFKVFLENDNANIELIAPISDAYPIVSQQIIFDVDKFWSFFYGTFNDAPKFVQDEAGGVDSKGRRRKIVKRFILKDDNRPAQTTERWNDTYLTEPLLKIMAIHPGGKLAREPIRDKIRNSLSIQAIFKRKVEREEMLSQNSTLIKSVKKRINSLKVKKMEKDAKVNTIYNAIRYEFLKERIAYQAFKEGNQNTLDYADRYYSMKSDVFAALFSILLDKNDIESDYVAVVPSYFGDVNTIITEQEIEYGVYVPSLKKYFWTVDNYRSIDTPFPKVAGATGYQITKKELSKKEPKFKKITLPESQPEENVSITNIDVKVNTNNTLDIQTVHQYTGVYKNSYSPLFLFQTPYLEEDMVQMGVKVKKAKHEENENKNLLIKARERVQQKKNRKEELSKKKKEMIEDWLKDNFKIKELKGFEVISIGRFQDDNVLSAELEFSSEDYLRKAGPNLILNVGELISSQIKLDEEEINGRQHTVELDYARTIENNISISLPESYQAQGLDALIMNIDNEHAAFISEAVQEGNTLTIKTSKIYKTESLPKENWPNLVEMLEAAYGFSQKKIILKK